MTSYSHKPEQLFVEILNLADGLDRTSFCVGFEMGEWRCDAYANHLIEWLADYALSEDELDVDHGNMYIRLRQAAIRIYDTDNYKKRGEIGEITLHAICRQFFDTIPIVHRVFYLTASNDVVKSFDLVHMRYGDDGNAELWLGEAKFYADRTSAVKAAIESVKAHIDNDFLNSQKLIIGPQISSTAPHFHQIRDLLSSNESLDKLFASAVFPICIAADSPSPENHAGHTQDYISAIREELEILKSEILASGLQLKIKILLIYVPLSSKNQLASTFDKKLKGILG